MPSGAMPTAARSADVLNEPLRRLPEIPRTRSVADGMLNSFVGRAGLTEQPLQVEPAGEHGQAPVGVPRPLLRGSVPVQLDSILVRVAEVKGLAHAVVTGTVQRDAGRQHATEGVR